MFDVVVIGASAGGINACSHVLKMLPKGFAWPILIVQHIHQTQKASVIADILKTKTKLPVKEATQKEIVQDGYVYIAPADYHMTVTKRKTLLLTQGEKVKSCRPAIDVLFKSAASLCQERVIGIVLTGANDDGSEGLAAIKNNGGYTIVQDPKTAMVDCMPKSAIARTYIDTILSPEEIGIFLGDMWQVFISSPITKKRRCRGL